MLGEADDLGLTPGLELRKGDELRVLRLLEIGLDRPAVRAPIREAEPLVDPLDHVVGERVTELVSVDVRLRRRIAHEIR